MPGSFIKLINRLKQKNIHHKLLFVVIGVLSTTWFLIRVIPKPSRANYPCMRATAPFMSSFVLYLLSLGGGTLALKHFRQSFLQSKYLFAFVLLVSSAALYLVSTTPFAEQTFARNISQIKGTFPPNEPIGEAKGIFPGRVVWMWDANATNEDCTNTSNNNGSIDENDDAWFMAKNSNIQVIDSMMQKSLLALTETETVAEAWDQIFRFYNESHGLGNVGYASGQKILIKVNATTAYGSVSEGRYDAGLNRNDDIEINPFSAETNPFVVLSVLRQLVNEAGVPQQYIYVGDPARNIYTDFYYLWHAEFPDANYLGNNLIHPELEVAALGRLPVALTETDRVFYSDNGSVMPDALSDKLFTLFDDIDYLINIPALKAHASAGITLAAKNHFGSFPRTWALHLHPGLMEGIDEPTRLGYGLYRIQTDIMMHKQLGGKNLLIVVDGLYPGEDALGVPEKWEMPPFNGDWCSSIFMSLDPVAIESVCHDFLRTEYNGPTIAESRPNWDGVDDYLHQAADSSLWPDGITYDPDNDGVIFPSLGVHEHWNNVIDKAYTRNLGTGNGIELIKAHESTIGLPEQNQKLRISLYPNPVTDRTQLINNENQRIDFKLLSSTGQVCLTGVVEPNSSKSLAFNKLATGIYFLQAHTDNSQQTLQIIKH